MKSFKQCLVIALVACTVQVQCQIVGVPGTSQTQFYLDRYSDCNGQPRDVGQSTVMILGTSTEPQGQPVTSCAITLNTENVREPYKFRLQILSVRIDNPNTYLYIYDGEYNGKLMWTFSKNQPKPSNLEFVFTTGQMVTFKFNRGEVERSYDIRIVAQPIRSEEIQCNYGSEYKCDEYGYQYRILGTKEIAGIIAGCFGLLLIIVIVIICCCCCRQRGISQKWKEEKLGHVNTAASIHSLNGKVSTKGPESVKGPGSTRAWTTDSSRNGFASIRRSPNLPRAKIHRSQKYGSDYSVSDNSDVTLPKRPLPPPHVSTNPRGTSERSGRRYIDRYSDDDRSSYEERSVSTKNFSERNFKPPTYREAMRQDSDSSADEHTFVGANDSAQQRVLVEKEIVPRYKPSPEVRRAQKLIVPHSKKSPEVLRAQRALPPPDQDMEYDSIEPKKTEKVLLVDKGAGSENETDESDTDNQSVEESEESSEESEEEEDERESKKDDKPDAMYSKPVKKEADDTGKNEPKEVPAVGFRPPLKSNNQQFQQASYPGNLPPGVIQPPAMYGYPGQGPYLSMQGQYPQGIPQYPQGYPQVYPQGPLPQVQPSNLPPRQPVPTQPNAYHQASFTVPLNQPQGGPPQYPAQPQASTTRGPSQTKGLYTDLQQNSGNIPVYSYLVNRGYKPIDGRHSPMSNSTGASNLSGDRNLTNDDSDFSANLASGVELMKRKT